LSEPCPARPTLGRLGLADERTDYSVDRGPVVAVGDVAEQAVQGAIRVAAGFWSARFANSLDEAGGVAALLRF